MAIVVMGVSGSGKTTVATGLAQRLGRDLLDADDLHPAANIAKLRAGQALTDADRAPWLAAVAGWLDAHPRGVTACSALRRAYRDRLRTAAAPVWFACLEVPDAVLAARLAGRRGHFMPAMQLPAQLATLEPLAPGEDGVRVDADRPVAETVAAIAAWAITVGA